MRKRVFITDCEGPVTKNDNAFELASAYIPNGESFFALMSRYDDYLCDIVKREGYAAGSTLKLILPFLAAFGLTHQKMVEFSKEGLSVMPGACDTLASIRSKMPAYIISTSYKPYLEAVSDLLDFPFKDIYCTEIGIDRYDIRKSEAQRLKEACAEIATMALFALPPVSDKERQTVERLDFFFWQELPDMGCYRLISETRLVGSIEKADALREIVQKEAVELADVIYFGDSITDVQAMQLVRGGGGVAVSFNGNEYAIREAEVAVLSPDTRIIAAISDSFHKGGRESVLEFVKVLSSGTGVEIVTETNLEELSDESSAFRKQVRGEKIGRLG